MNDALIRENEEAELCCICLDSLCSAPVTVALVEQSASRPQRACAHFLHASCAEQLVARKCALCRCPFDLFSAPISRDLLSNVGPVGVFAGIQFLAGRQIEAIDTVPADTTVELLAATLPVRHESLQAAAEYECANGELTVDNLACLLERFSLVQTSAAPASEQELVSGHTLTTKVARAFRCLALRITGAAGKAVMQV